MVGRAYLPGRVESDRISVISRVLEIHSGESNHDDEFRNIPADAVKRRREKQIADISRLQVALARVASRRVSSYRK